MQEPPLPFCKFYKFIWQNRESEIGAHTQKLMNDNDHHL